MVPHRKPRGDKGVILAIGLAIITMVAVAWGWHWLSSTTPELTGNTGREEEVSGYYPGGYTCNPSAIGPFPDGVNSGEAEACKEAREEHRLKANDLIQQTRSADAADNMAGLGYKQTLLGIVGMGFGFLTFCAATAAAIYARQAADATQEAAWHAKCAVDEARSGNLIVNTSAINERRPWIAIEIRIDDNIIFQSNGVISTIAIVKFKNIGQSPAIQLKVNCIMWTGVSPERNATDNPAINAIDYEISRFIEKWSNIENVETFTILPGEFITRKFGVFANYSEKTMDIRFVAGGFYIAEGIEGTRHSVSVGGVIARGAGPRIIGKGDGERIDPIGGGRAI